MDKFNLSRFPTVKHAPKRKRKVFLKDGCPVTEPDIKEEQSADGPSGAGAFGAMQLGVDVDVDAAAKGGAGTSWGRAAKKRPPKKQQRTTIEADQLETAKQISLQERSKQVSLLDLEYPLSGVFTPKFVSKDGQPLLNTQRPSTDRKSACNIMDCLYIDAELTALSEMSDADIEDSYAHALYQSRLYLHGLKQRNAYHRQQSATELASITGLEEEKSELKRQTKELKKDKEKFEREANDLAGERNKLREEVRLKTGALYTLNTAMEQLKADRDKDVVAAKEAAKANLMKDYWVRVVEAYRIGFHDGDKGDLYDRYFENLEEYDAKANTSSILPPLPEAQEGETDDDDTADPDKNQIFLENYIRDFVDKLLYEVGCALIDEIADQVMTEDEGDREKDASRLQLRSKKRGDRDAQKGQASEVIVVDQVVDAVINQINQVPEDSVAAVESGDPKAPNSSVVVDETGVVQTLEQMPPVIGA